MLLCHTLRISVSAFKSGSVRALNVYLCGGGAVIVEEREKRTSKDGPDITETLQRNAVQDVVQILGEEES